MKIDWDRLEMAFGTRDPEGLLGEAFLDRSTGEVVWVGGDVDAVEDEVDVDSIDDTRFLAIPTIDTQDEVSWMNAFYRSVRDRALMHALDQAFSGGKGLFRRFNDALARHGALDRWHELRRRKLAERMVEWLRDSKIEFEGLPRPLQNSSIATLEPVAHVEDDQEDRDVPIRATIQNVLTGGDIVRLGDAVEALEASVRGAEFEYEVTVRVRADHPLRKKARDALERRAITAMGARPTFANDVDEAGGVLAIEAPRVPPRPRR